MIQLGPNEKIFSPRYDFVFKSMFTQNTPESKGALMDFLESVIGRKVADVIIIENEPAVTGPLEKQSTMDLNCKFNDGDQANIEIQLHSGDDMRVRAEYHLCKLHGGQAIKGKPYDALHYTYQITIADYPIFPDDIFFDAFMFRSAAGRSLDGRTCIYFLELTKLGRLLEKPTQDLSRAEMWALYIKYVDDTKKRDIINQMIQKEAGLAMASTTLQKLAEDDAARVTLLSIEKAELDRESQLYYAKQKGIEIGREEGVQIGRESGYRDLLQSMRETGMTLEAIAKATKLDPAKIQELLSQAK